MPLNPIAAIARPTYEAPMNDWLSTEEDMAIADVRKTAPEDIVIGVLRLAGLRVAENAVGDGDLSTDGSTAGLVGPSDSGIT